MCRPKKYFTFDCTHEKIIFAQKHSVLLDLTKHTIEPFFCLFVFFVLRPNVKEKNSPEKEKNKINGHFFPPGNHFT